MMQPHTARPAPHVDDRDVPLHAGSGHDVFAEGRDRLRWQTPPQDPRVADAARLIVDRARSRSGQPIDTLAFGEYRRFDDDGDRASFQASYFSRRRRLWDAAIAGLLTDEDSVGDVEDLIWAVCDEYAWALPAHIRELTDTDPDIPHDHVIDLYAAETAFALAEITALFGERIHPLVRHRVRTEVERRVLAPFRTHEWWWESIPTNWSAVCAAGVGLAAMHLDTVGLGAILLRCTTAMHVLLSGYGEDGVCLEGLGYWAYGFGHFAIYAEALRQRTGEDLWTIPKVAHIAGFGGEVALGGNATVTFSDTSSDARVPPALAALLATRFPYAAPVPHTLWEHDPVKPGNWGLAVRTFIWADASPTVTVDPPDRWYPDAQWLIARRPVQGSEVGFAAKVGSNDEPHNHNDVGSFLLVVDGEQLLADLGAGAYDRDYFDPAHRYESPAAGSHGHSVPLIDGACQRDGPGTRGQVMHVHVEPGNAELRADLTAAYTVDGLSAVTRQLHFASDALELRDLFVAERPIEIVDRLVSRYPIELDGDGALIRGDRTGLRIAMSAASAREWRPRTGEFTFRDRPGDVATAYTIDFCRTVATAAELIVSIRLEPADVAVTPTRDDQ